MPKASPYSRVFILFLTVLLLFSVGLNVYLFRQADTYYRELNIVRLDPLGINFEAASTIEPERPLVIFYGDSRAAGWPAPDLPQYSFVNRGIGGQTSTQVAERFDRHVLPLKPRAVVVQVCINDLKVIPLFPDSQEIVTRLCIQNIQGIVNRSKKLGAVVILTTVFPVGAVPLERRPYWSAAVPQAIGDVNGLIRSLDGDGVMVLDAYEILAGANGQIRPEYSLDLLHLSEAGYERLNQALVPLLDGLP